MITTRGRRVRAAVIALAIAGSLVSFMIGFKTGDRCYPTFKAGSCFEMIDSVVGK